MHIFFKQFLALLWKHGLFRIRHSFATLMEFLTPLWIVVICIFVRNLDLKFFMGNCFFAEKFMDSMTPIMLVKDILCTFNSTCYNRTQIDWNDTITDMQTLIKNVTEIYYSFPEGELGYYAISGWIDKNPKEFQKLKYVSQYVKGKMRVAAEEFRVSNASEPGDMLKGINKLSGFLCNSPENDMVMFVTALFANKDSRKTRDSECQAQLRKNLVPELYEVMAPLLYGKIYYAPQSKFTDELIKKANFSFELLDNLRLATIEWRLNFRKWFLGETRSGVYLIDYRVKLWFCVTFVWGNMNWVCKEIRYLLNQDNIDWAIELVHPLFEPMEYLLSCIDLNKFVPMSSAADINNLTTKNVMDIFAGIIFDPTTKYLTSKNATFLNYTIRIPTSRLDSTKSLKVLDRFWTPSPRRVTMMDMRYYTSGFILVQEAIDRGFIELVTGELVNIGTSFQIMPYPCYTEDTFVKFASDSLPILLTMSWAPIFALLVIRIAWEKETMTKEYMLVMGLSPYVYWLTWFTVSIIITVLPSILTAVLLKVYKILEYSSLGVVFLLLLSYNVSFITQAFMLTVFFNRANEAAIASVLFYFVFYLPFVLLIKIQDRASRIFYGILGLFSQVSFCNGVGFVTYWEQGKQGAQFKNIFLSPVKDFNFGIGHCIIILWIDAFVHVLVAWYVASVFPGHYGIGRKWNFMFKKSYWLKKKQSDNRKHIKPRRTIFTIDGVYEDFQAHLEIGISIRHLTKRFDKNNFSCVDDLDFDIYKSHITGLLGNNGAGKSIILSIFSGILAPTFGTVYVLNEDIRTDIRCVRKFIGSCPENNILFDYLTVEEHIYFYGLIKAVSLNEIILKSKTIIDDAGLINCNKVRSNKLSYGMKRKLSVAMAFIGDPEIVLLDNPTAGLDIISCRNIWELLVKHRRPTGTIIFTTHRTEEAEYICDRIAIISNGKLKSFGSPAYVKKQYSNNSYLKLTKSIRSSIVGLTDNFNIENSKNILSFVQKHITNADIVEENESRYIFRLGSNVTANKAYNVFFKDLDKSLKTLNIASYNYSAGSLADLFDERLEADEHSANYQLQSIMSRLNQYSLNNSTEIENTNLKVCHQSIFSSLYHQILALEKKRFNHWKSFILGYIFEVVAPILMIVLLVLFLILGKNRNDEQLLVIHPWLMMPKVDGPNLHTFYRKENTTYHKIDKLVKTFRTDIGECGARCMNQSVYKLQNLECMSTSNRNWSSGPTMNISQNSPLCACNIGGYQKCPNPLSGGPPNSHRLMASTDILNNLTGYNLSDHLLKKFEFYSQKMYGGFQMVLVNGLGKSCDYIASMSVWDIMRELTKITGRFESNPKAIKFINHFQRFLILAGTRTHYCRIWVNMKGYIAMPAYSNILGNVLLRSHLNSTDNLDSYGISVASHPFPYYKLDIFSLLIQELFFEISFSNFIILSLSIIPAGFVMFLIEERVSGVKRQQFLCGLNPYVYWLSNFLCDIVKYAMSVWLLILVFLIFNYQAYIGRKNIGACISTLMCYGFAIIPQMYVFTFIISTPSIGFLIVSIYNLFLGTITTMTTFFIDQLEAEVPTLKPVNDALKLMFLIFPQYCLGKGMVDLSFRYLIYENTNGKMDYEPFSFEMSGAKITSLIILFVLWSFVIFLMESGVPNRIINCNFKWSFKCRGIFNRQTTSSLAESEEIFKVMNLTKGDKNRCFVSTIKNEYINTKDSFYSLDSLDFDLKNIVINNVNFVVNAGECLGLLGVNGSWKTMLYKMLTGEESITYGEAMIKGMSIITDRKKALENVGYCPQYDALHSYLTCKEELYLFCNIRRIHPSLTKSTIEDSLSFARLEPYSEEIIKTLSGGNKRKLSTAIAFLGHPKIVFLDDPTIGMDATARRFLAIQIKQLIGERGCVILTTQFIPDYDGISERMIIMDRGKCHNLENIPALKLKLSNNYLVSLRMHSNFVEIKESVMLKEIMNMKFWKAVSFKGEHFGLLEFEIDYHSNIFYKIFEFLENLKSTRIIVDYFISQKSFNEMFMNVVKDISLKNDDTKTTKLTENI